MSTADEAAKQPFLATQKANLALGDSWRGLRRSATLVTVVSAPAAFLWAWQHTGLSLGWAIFLSRQGLEDPLKHPLAQTLPSPRTRLVPGRLSGQDLAVINRYITQAYTYSGEQLQDGSPVLMLRPAS